MKGVGTAISRGTLAAASNPASVAFVNRQIVRSSSCAWTGRNGDGDGESGAVVVESDFHKVGPPPSHEQTICGPSKTELRSKIARVSEQTICGANCALLVSVSAAGPSRGSAGRAGRDRLFRRRGA